MAKKYTCEIQPYQLTFKSPAQTSRDTLKTRDIWVISIMDNFGRGQDGFGEIAPLKGLSKELELDFENKLVEVSENIEHYLNNLHLLKDYPSILFGVESAWLSYKHLNYIFFKSPFTKGEKTLPINALVWMGDYEYMKSQVDEILKKEVKCIKLKIGGIDFAQELDLLKYIRKYRSEKTLEIRLEANGGLKAADAINQLKLLSEFHIHSIEQPIATNQHEDLISIIKESPIPIALDEELIGINTYKEKWQLLESLNPSYIVLKPSIHGGLIGCEEWIFIAEQFKIDWWITSALESNVGLNTIAQWSSQYEKCYTTPQGLGTGHLFKNNFPTHLDLVDYQMYLLK